MAVVIRAYRDDDREALATLRMAVARLDRTAEGIVVTEPPADPVCTTAEPHKDTYVAADAQGRIVGAAQLQVMTGPDRSFIWAFPVVHPNWRGTDGERLLLERLWGRACELRSRMHSTLVHFYVHCAPWEEERVALHKGLGLRPLRERPHMIYEPLTTLARPDVPAGIEVRPYARGGDDESALGTINEAFSEDWEYTLISTDDWSVWLSSPQWRPDLNLVAVDADEVVGLCLCLVSEERNRWLGRRDGYVETVCVRPSHRRQGLARALLLTGLGALRKADMISATLDTDEDNPTHAARLYERVGFREIWRWLASGTELR